MEFCLLFHKCQTENKEYSLNKLRYDKGSKIIVYYIILGYLRANTFPQFVLQFVVCITNWIPPITRVKCKLLQTNNSNDEAINWEKRIPHSNTYLRAITQLDHDHVL